MTISAVCDVGIMPPFCPTSQIVFEKTEVWKNINPNNARSTVHGVVFDVCLSGPQKFRPENLITLFPPSWPGLNPAIHDTSPFPQTQMPGTGPGMMPTD